ncbi:LysR family hydrogen peroxide-inducible transcriptional activator [Novosphingobium sp. SG751A]|uniref:LysR family transcriptional regulator n=1 Tax=Novosphingobium sp. SG751A TaxID=2587000 RepID=UPI00155723C5|nr:LysR family hydrogen peroxide-inducible transcriptional activator [Novosphingobium sp. SG751A]
MSNSENQASRTALRARNHRVRSTNRPDFRQLETFLKVSETRSFAEAARQLGVSQPAVSQTIARLEELYGGDLFERRRGTPVALTPIGRAVLPTVKLLLFTVDRQISRALATAQSMTGSLTIGFYPGLTSSPLSAGIVEFHQSCPGVQLRFVEAAPGELHRQLNERILDITFTALLPELTGGAVVKERLWEEPLVVGIRDDHPLAANENLRWADLSSLPILLRAHQGDLSAYRAVTSRAGDQALECELHDVSRSALIEMVRLGLGAAITLASATVPRDGIAFRPIVDENAAVGIDAVWPKDDRNPLRHRLLACVRKHASAAQPSVSKASRD